VLLGLATLKLHLSLLVLALMLALVLGIFPLEVFAPAVFAVAIVGVTCTAWGHRRRPMVQQLLHPVDSHIQSAVPMRVSLGPWKRYAIVAEGRGPP
jgi:xanthosine utilization system XapX-like protein